MGIFGKIINAISSPLGLAKEVAGIAGKLFGSPEEQHEFELAAATLIQTRDSEIEETLRAEMQAKERVLVAELQQGDKFTKRARPSLVYVGLLLAVLEAGLRIVLVVQGQSFPEGLTTVVPAQFWVAWTGVTGTWVIGRSVERRGVKNSVVSAITGNHAS